MGWGEADTTTVVRDKASFTVAIGSDQTNPVTVTLTETCPADTEAQVIPIEGGCVTYQVPPGTEPGTVPSFDDGLAFIDRSELVASVEQNEDLTLCGALAPPCAPDPEV